MEKVQILLLCFNLHLLVLAILFPFHSAQLTSSESRILSELPKLLEYPKVLQGWNDWTNFCYLPRSPSVRVVCSDNHVTELSITGNKTSIHPNSGNFTVSKQSLSAQFNIDSFFTTVTKLSNLKVLSLVSLGLWGSLPPKIDRFWSLEVFNLSSNFIYGEIPNKIASLKTLKSLVLADNMLNGSVPDLEKLVSLKELNLGGNIHLGSEFPSVSSNIETIILVKNSMRSEIPKGLKKFNQLKRLDISSNQFSGSIPSFLFSLPSLEYLNLAENKLSGPIPINSSCGKNLSFVDISHNLLMGKLPTCIGSDSPKTRRVISSWNCLVSSNNGDMKYQHRNSYCRKEALAAEPEVGEKSDEKESGMKMGLVIGIIIGGVMALGLVLGGLVMVFLRRSERGGKGEDEKKYERSVADKLSVRNSPKPVIESRRVPQTMRSAAIGLSPYRVFNLEEIEEATNNFDPANLIGEGSQGQLYKAWLRDGSRVVVKCIKLKQRHLPQSLIQQQLEALSKLRHRHLVSVLGHCIVTYQDHQNSTSTVFVILESISNDSLGDYLTDWKKREMLKWPQRMAIIIGAARGIQFLHTGVAPGIFGNDLKIENILLDETLTAKLSGYNVPLSSRTGSEGPSGGGVEDAEKEDVYQLGVILLQIIIGKLIKSPSEVEDLKLELERCLGEPASSLRALTDPSVRGTYAYDSLRTTVEITINCLSKYSSRRPSVEDVLWNLQYSIQVQEGWQSSGNLST